MVNAKVVLQPLPVMLRCQTNRHDDRVRYAILRLASGAFSLATAVWPENFVGSFMAFLLLVERFTFLADHRCFFPTVALSIENYSMDPKDRWPNDVASYVPESHRQVRRAA